MQSKTPHFDSILDVLLAGLVPHTRKCIWAGMHPHCESDFDITDKDIEFLTLLRVPTPSYCPTCRRIRRGAFMGTNRLFKRSCDVPGHSESVISVLPPECPFPVYDYMHFISDAFDPFSFGTTYTKGESPLEVLHALRRIFPMPSFLNRDSLSINSEYSNGGRNLKNGYFAFGCFSSENMWYSNFSLKSKDVMDSRSIRYSEFVYHSLSSDYVYKSSYIYFSSHIIESMFLFDCRNCDYCFGCVNLRNKKYCIFNEQYTKEDYESFIASITPLSRDHIVQFQEKFWTLVKKLPMNASHNIGSSNVSGVGLVHSNDVYDIVDADNSQHVRYAEGILSHKDSMDILFSGGHSHNLYSTMNVGSESSNVKFSVSSKFCTDCEFVFNSKNLSNCFMCFGLQNKSYCILNIQYTPEEYCVLLDELKTAMLSRGEYGDGLGFEFSAQPYNFSTVGATYPLDVNFIRQHGGYVISEPETNMGDMDVVDATMIPLTITGVTSDILNKAIMCTQTHRPFRIIASELEFYKVMGLPLPVLHPTYRMGILAVLRPTSKKYKTICAQCGDTIDSLFNPIDGYTLYCEKCYQQEVI